MTPGGEIIMSCATIQGPQACTKADLPGVITLVDEAMRQGTEQTMLTDYPLVYRDENLPNIQILKVDDKVVSVVPFIPRPTVMDGCRFTVGIISPTATAPTHRRKGYGLRCLNRCIQLMEQAGIELSVLWTRVETFPFYECSDYQAVRSQTFVYQCSHRDADLFTNHSEEIVQRDPDTDEYLEEIQTMHEQEGCGVVRNPDEYSHLFALPNMKTLIAQRDGQPQAYLVVSQAANKPGLIEGGGEHWALESLVRYALSQLSPGEEVAAYSYHCSTALGDLFEKKLADRRQAASDGMMVRINNIPGFFAQIAPWLEKTNATRTDPFSVSLTDTGQTISFAFSADGLRLGDRQLQPHLEITRQKLTSIIFGPHPQRPVTIPGPLADLFPFYFPIWILDHS